MKTFTTRTLFERETILKILEVAEFEDSIHFQIIRKNKPAREFYLAVFVFSADPQNDGSLLVRPISSTVVGLRHSARKDLESHEAVCLTQNPHDWVIEWCVRIFEQSNKSFTINSNHWLGIRSIAVFFAKHFPNGAGDLPSPPQIVLTDPDFEELERLYNPDTKTDLDDTDE